MFTRDAAPAKESVKDGRRVAGRAAPARSAAYVKGQATRNALRRLAVRIDRRAVRAGEEPPIGAHLVTPRRGYTHHGIYVGEGKVVHYAGLHRSFARGPVEEISLDLFADGQVVLVKNARPLFPAAAIVERARSRLGENRYRITTNNCEHFCEWCLRGVSRSEQIEFLIALPGRLVRASMARLRQGIRARSARTSAA